MTRRSEIPLSVLREEVRRKKRRADLLFIAVAVLIIGCGLVVSRLSAEWGHPSAVWLWRDLLGFDL